MPSTTLIAFCPMDTHENEKAADELTTAQKEKLRGLFEPKYGRKLSDQELWEIHFNLKRFFVAINKVS